MLRPRRSLKNTKSPANTFRHSREVGNPVQLMIMPNQIFYATNNPGKLEEAKVICRRFNIEVLSPKDLNLEIDPEETGKTYYENALLKVQAFRPYVPSEIVLVGDDSGLEIPALNNEPGLHSRRWKDGKTAMTDQEALDYCLERMKMLSGRDREAHFVGTLVAHDGIQNEVVATGYLRGRMLESPLSDAPQLTGYPFRALFQELSTGKMLYELEEGEAPTHRDEAFRKLFQSLKFS